MPSPREKYKEILVRNLPIIAPQTWTSKTVNAEGRDKVTFLVYCETTPVPPPGTPACEVTCEWSWTGQTRQDPASPGNPDFPWYPLQNTIALPVEHGQLLRFTLDDALTYLRIKVSNFATPSAVLSAWVIAI